MEIRKLAESDYDAVLELYQALDELHVQARRTPIPKTPFFRIWQTLSRFNWAPLWMGNLWALSGQRSGKRVR